MSTRKLSLLILYLSFFLVVFYPLKGLVSFSVSLLAGDNIAMLLIPFLFFFVFAFVFLNMGVNGFALTTGTDKILFVVGLFAAAFAIAMREKVLLYNTVLLFCLPVLFSSFRKIDERYFYNVILVFFAISSIYLLAENIVLHPHGFGLSFVPPSYEQLAAYTNYMVSDPHYDALFNVIDYRHAGIGNRTAGYLGAPLPMATLIAMAATFFYVSMREQFKPVTAIFAVISIFLVVASLSTTALVAFILTVIFYEGYINRKKKIFYLVAAICIAWLLASWLPVGEAISYLYHRFLTNLKNPAYVGPFFSQHMALFNMDNMPYLFYGKWSWNPPAGASSHVDLVSIVVAYGGVIAFLLYRRMLAPLGAIRHFPHSYGRIFFCTFLTAFICLFHASMVLNINVMMLATLLYLKSGDIFRQSPKEMSGIKPVIENGGSSRHKSILGEAG